MMGMSVDPAKSGTRGCLAKEVPGDLNRPEKLEAQRLDTSVLPGTRIMAEEES